MSKIQRGASSAASPLTADLLAADSVALPPALKSTGTLEPELREIQFSRYWDPSFAALEKERLWGKVWQYACREEDLPNIGDRLRYDVGTQSYMLVRSAPDRFQAFYNSCLHRGTQLCWGPASSERIRCPFHAWEWNLDGTLHNIPSAWDFKGVERERYVLPEIKLARWGGFIFVNPDPSAPPLERALGVLPEHFRSWGPEDRFTFVHVRKRIRANWKTTLDAFMEAYHVIETHFDAMPFTGDASTQYDIWDDGSSHISRLITPAAVPSPHLGDNASQQAAIDGMLQAYAAAMGTSAAELPKLNVSKGGGRAQLAQWRRQMLQAQFNRDFSSLADAEVLDSIQYLMFPNFCPWYGEGLPLVYQFLPLGSNPEESVMDIRLLLPVPGGGVPRPPSAAVIELGFDDRFEAAPQLGILTHIFEQDMANLPHIQAGMRSAAASRARATLGRYQECRIQHFHNTLDRYLGL